MWLSRSTYAAARPESDFTDLHRQASHTISAAGEPHKMQSLDFDCMHKQPSLIYGIEFTNYARKLIRAGCASAKLFEVCAGVTVQHALPHQAFFVLFASHAVAVSTEHTRA